MFFDPNLEPKTGIWAGPVPGPGPGGQNGPDILKISKFRIEIAVILVAKSLDLEPYGSNWWQIRFWENQQKTYKLFNQISTNINQYKPT